MAYMVVFAHTRTFLSDEEHRAAMKAIAAALTQVQDEARNSVLPSEEEFKKWYFETAGIPIPEGNFHSMAKYAYDWLRANMSQKDEIANVSNEHVHSNNMKPAPQMPSEDEVSAWTTVFAQEQLDKDGYRANEWQTTTAFMKWLRARVEGDK